MEITQLTYFKTVAKYESFTKAAMELHITQSALSRSIAQLESEIGVLLFERKKGGKITLNNDGRFFLQHVIQMLNGLDNTVAAVKERAGLERGVIQLALNEGIYIRHILRRFLLDHSNVQVNCTFLSDEQIKVGLDDCTLNFAICDHQIYGQELEWTPLCRDPLAVMLPPGHPLISRRSIAAEELREEKFIIRYLGTEHESPVIRLCQKAGFTPRIIYKGTEDDLCTDLVADGVGVMIVPHSLYLGRSDAKGRTCTAAVPLSDDFAFHEIGIMRKPGQFQSAAAQELLARISSYFAALRSQNEAH